MRCFSYKRTAAELGMSINTLQTHVKSLYLKRGVHSREELIDKYRGHIICGTRQGVRYSPRVRVA